jgi:hypothetical protein
MKTIIIQSYRTENVPRWITDCMKTVKDWADSQGYHYFFLDDAFFDFVPSWIRTKHPNALYPKVDIARLYMIKDCIQEYDTVMWFDADIFIFNPEGVNILKHLAAPYAFSLERTISDPNNNLYSEFSLNNSFMYFRKEGLGMLDSYIEQSEERLRNVDTGKTQNCEIGPNLLRVMAEQQPLNAITFNGVINSYILIGFTKKESRLKEYSKMFGYEQFMANMCHNMLSVDNRTVKEVIESAIGRTMKLLYDSKGAILSPTKRGIPIINYKRE